MEVPMLETEAPQPTLRGRRLLGAALVLAVVAALLAAVAATRASADTVSKCPGRMIDHEEFGWGGHSKAGQIELYYSNGYNCAMTRDFLPGKAKMGATLHVCDFGSLSSCNGSNKPFHWVTEDTPNLWWNSYSDGAMLWAGGRCVYFEGDYDHDVGGRKAVHPSYSKGWNHCS
jgi:hypothetical protein